MTTYMSDILCVTNRKLCSGEFLSRVEEIAKAAPAGILFREKDLPEEEYKALAKEVMEICNKYQVPCMLHSFIQVAVELESPAIHLPLPLLRTMTAEEKVIFSCIGASCHSVEEAKEAERLGCTYIIAGHIFATDCKKGVPPRGIGFLQEVCLAVNIPVYAIGGISAENVDSVRRAGVAGACIMSGLMECEKPDAYVKQLI